MAAEEGTGRFFIPVFLELVALVCVFEAGDSVRAHDYKPAALWFVLGLIFSIVGFAWPRIKAGFTINRRYYRWVVGVVVVAVLAGLTMRTIYHHFHPSAKPNTAQVAQLPISPPVASPPAPAPQTVKPSAPKTKPNAQAVQPPNTAKPPSVEEQDGREKLNVSDSIKAKVTRNPAIEVTVNRQRRITVTDEVGAPLKGAEILFVRQNGTHSNEVVSDDLGVAEVLIPDEVMTVFCAEDGFSAYYKKDYDPTTPLTIKLERNSSGGSVTIAEGVGEIPGLTGRINPILDTEDRLYLYATNIAINGAEKQPVKFALHRPLTLEDKYGHKFEIEFVAVVGASWLIEYRRI